MWCFSREHEGGRIKLKCVLKKWDEMASPNFIVLGLGKVVRSCECSIYT
jgi:hypothetical protein